MFLTLNHQKLEVFIVTRKFVSECYKLSLSLPKEEQYALASQLRRAAVSVYLNFSEGSSRKSITERKRFYEIARGSLIEIDSILDLAHDLDYLKNYNLDKICEYMINSFRLLSGMI